MRSKPHSNSRAAAGLPFEGRRVKGCVTKVVLRGVDAYKDGRVLVEKGLGRM